MLGLLGRKADPLTRDGVRWLLDNQEAGRLVVRALGRQPRLRHRALSCRRWSRPVSRRPTPRSGVRSAGSSSTRTPTAAGARTAARTTTRPGSVAARARRRRPPGRCWRWRRPASATPSATRRGVELAGREPARGRRLGRAAPHGHGIPVGLLHQVPPLPADLPGDGAGAVHAMSATAQAGAVERRRSQRCPPASRCCPRRAGRTSPSPARPRPPPRPSPDGDLRLRAAGRRCRRRGAR